VMAQPVSIQTTSGVTQTMNYDGAGSRLTVSSAGTTQLYLRDPMLNPLRVDTIVDGNPATVYNIYGPNGLVAFKTASSVQFPLKDHLGSTRVIIDNFNAVVGAVDYMPYGQPLRINGDLTTSQLFTGEHLDALTGMYAYQARMY